MKFDIFQLFIFSLTINLKISYNSKYRNCTVEIRICPSLLLNMETGKITIKKLAAYDYFENIQE